MFPHVTRAAQARLLGSLYHEAAFASMTRFEPDPKKLTELNAIYARHGVATGPLDPKRAAGAAIEDRFQPVADKPALVRELLGFLKRHGERTAPKKDPQQAASEVWGAALEEVKVDGDAAAAVVEVKKGAAARRQPLTFRREGGRWRVDWR